MKAKFITDTEKRIEEIKQAVAKAHEPKAEWSQYNGTVQQQRYDEQVRSAVETAKSKLLDLGLAIETETKKNQETISRTLYPMFHSPYSADRTRGESNRTYSIAFVAGLKNVEQFRKEYEETMNLSDIDLATRLLDQGELRWSQLPNEKALLNELKKNHVESLNLNEPLLEREQIKTLKRSFDQTMKMYSAGIYKPLTVASYGDELQDIMIQAGLAV